jgi:hypothetical protein
MKNFILSNIVILLPIILVADSGFDPIPSPLVCPTALSMSQETRPSCIKTPDDGCTLADLVTSILTEHEHRLNFGFLNVGYERIQQNSIYVGADIKGTFVYTLDGEKEDYIDHFFNGELRMGYNHAFTERDVLTPYAGLGFSVFKFEKKDGNLRDWNYAIIGAKYSHQFGDIFEMGAHLKTYLSIQEKRTSLIEEKKKYKFNIKDSRWMMEASLPMIWHVGATKNWEIQLEPYYMQIPNGKRLHLLGSRLSFGFRF